MAEPELRIFVVVGEESGDALAGPLVEALRTRYGDRLKVSGLAGPRLTAQGVESLFPISDIAVMGLDAVLARLPLLLRRIRETVTAAVAACPRVVLIVDSPDFTHRVARRVRKLDPSIPIVAYVSPSVWAWRPGRAKAMTGYVDHLLALLPFEPGVHQRLGGPPCSYVGHRLIESLTEFRPAPGERQPLDAAERPTVLVLPGSRRGELDRHDGPLKEAVARIADARDVELILPAVEYLQDDIRRRIENWPTKPVIVSGEAAKYAAFRKAHVALAASGTVSLELALAGIPMVVMYKLDRFYRLGRRLNRYLKLVKYDSIVLPNIILGETPVSEFIDEEATPDVLAREVLDLLSLSEARARQLSAFDRLDDVMAPEGGVAPSVRAAEIIANLLEPAR